MAGERILVVDDDEDILELLRYNLTKEGYSVACVASGEQVLAKVEEISPQLIVLDLMLPKVNGLEICRSLKADPATRAISVVMLTAKSQESDIVTGLEFGADDYITKPFSQQVLSARIRAALRRQSAGLATASQLLTLNEIVIDLSGRTVVAAGRPVPLTNMEFRVLLFLASKPGFAFTRLQIVDGIQGDDYPVTERSVDVHVAGLRKKLGDQAIVIETVRGVGYRVVK
jgi:two-component system alkaline phosphatase synthesis response regulator PhoP